MALDNDYSVAQSNVAVTSDAADVLVEVNYDTYIVESGDADVAGVPEESWDNRGLVQKDFIAAWDSPSRFFNALTTVVGGSGVGGDPTKIEEISAFLEKFDS